VRIRKNQSQKKKNSEIRKKIVSIRKCIFYIFLILTNFRLDKVALKKKICDCFLGIHHVDGFKLCREQGIGWPQPFLTTFIR
jgi:hypothetical protein